MAPAAVLPGCGRAGVDPPGDVSAADVEGSWHTDNGDGRRTELVLRPDGTLTWSGVPDGLRDDLPETAKLRWETRTDYEGTWSVEQSTSWYQPVVKVQCKIAGGWWGFELTFEGRGPGRQLMYWIGDPDSADRLKFRR
ncbi:hypothetical protein [Pseudarthrobacter sp. efr-133-R2A-89]|uniref:hypothetical protein n=1 Tax=Pseudarthrobacter sp. efr-133-R2A-89 TaxID=3040302 RepID=UPI002553C4A1|nr:hypothetical protein [Pseudarthrobacter sp. efr-133-R2A-89]